jgi:lipopolysaccharide transport system permease protein
MTEKITEYTPDGRSNLGFFQTLALMFRQTWESRELIYQLYKRDFLMMYKKSFFGMGWIILAPLISLVSWFFLKSAGVLQPGETGVPYWVFLLIGTSIWGYFKNLVLSTSKTLTIGQSFINQVYYPHHILLFKQIFEEFTKFSIVFIFSTILIFALGMKLSWTVFLYPFLLLPLTLLAASTGLICSVISGVTKDIEKILTTVLSFFMFVTPVVYSPDVKNGMVQIILRYNPLTYLLGDARSVFLNESDSFSTEFYIISLVTILLFALFMRWFFVAEERIIEKMV